MVITLMLALASAFVLSLTFVPALAALSIRGQVAEHEKSRSSCTAKRFYEPRLRSVLARPFRAIVARRVRCSRRRC